MEYLEKQLLDFYRSKDEGTHTAQELLEWTWLEVKNGLEKKEGNGKNQNN